MGEQTVLLKTLELLIMCGLYLIVVLSVLFKSGASYSWGQSSTNHVSSYNAPRVSHGPTYSTSSYNSGPTYSTSSYNSGPKHSTTSYSSGPTYSTTSYNSSPSYSTSYSSSPAHGYRSGSLTHGSSYS